MGTGLYSGAGGGHSGVGQGAPSAWHFGTGRGNAAHLVLVDWGRSVCLGVGRMRGQALESAGRGGPWAEAGPGTNLWGLGFTCCPWLVMEPENMAERETVAAAEALLNASHTQGWEVNPYKCISEPQVFTSP